MVTNELSRVAKFISKRLDELASKKSQREVAEEAGFPKPNIMTMFKTGQTKVPLDRVVDLARALEVPENELFLLVLEQLYPDPKRNPVNAIFNGIVPTKSEVDVLTALRDVAGKVTLKNNDPRIGELKEAFTKIFSKENA